MFSLECLFPEQRILKFLHAMTKEEIHSENHVWTILAPENGCHADDERANFIGSVDGFQIFPFYNACGCDGSSLLRTIL
jgi:hypothetical protein